MKNREALCSTYMKEDFKKLSLHKIQRVGLCCGVKFFSIMFSSLFKNKLKFPQQICFQNAES